MLKGKKVLVGLCGSIAAYKTAFLIRLLIKEGAEVRVIMTPSSMDFITPLTLSTLSKNPVFSEFKNEQGTWHNHVELGMWADVFVIAPASANTIASMAAGLCNNLLLSVYLSAKCPVFVAPAMDLDMHRHPATKNNISTIISFGNHVIPSETGELASGLEGEGRMAEPENILKALQVFFLNKKKLAGKKVLITAGPTFEAIDPVRFIGNYSSGKMGYELAEACANSGAEVVLISGPSNCSTTNNNIKVEKIVTAGEMYQACMGHFKNSDLAILSAAVADYRPAEIQTEKIKKKDENLQLHLVKNKDILGELGRIKNNKQILIGFALETNNELTNAEEKLKSKNLDMIVLNSLKDPGAGFSKDTNLVTCIHRSGKKNTTGLFSKRVIANMIIEEIYNNYFDQKV